MDANPAHALRSAGQAWIKLLSKPLDGVKWLALAFCFWLSDCGRSSGIDLSRSLDYLELPSGGGFPQAPSDWSEPQVIVLVAAAAAIVGVLLLAMVGFYLVSRFLNARGRFMWVDQLLRRDANLRESWGEWGSQANSVFVLDVGLGLFQLLCSAVLLGGTAALGYAAYAYSAAWLGNWS